MSHSQTHFSELVCVWYSSYKPHPFGVPIPLRTGSDMRATHFLVLLLPFASGCGTFANLNGREHPLISIPGQIMPRPFGGVARDVQWMIEKGHVGEEPFECRASDLFLFLAWEGFFILDLPLSLIGDVAT